MTAHELDHLAIAVPHWADARAVLGDALGGRWLSGFRMPEFCPGLVGFADDMRIELLEPGSEPTSFVRRFLESHGAGPHHITFKVHDIERSISAAREQGIEPILVRIDNDRWREAFLHPSHTGLGFLVQMVEATIDPADAAAQMRAAPPAWGEPERQPAAITAVWGTVDDWAGPDRVLCGILGAEAADLSSTTRRFRWNEGADLILTRRSAVHTGRGVQIVVHGPRTRVDLSIHELDLLLAHRVPELGVSFAALPTPAPAVRPLDKENPWD